MSSDVVAGRAVRAKKVTLLLAAPTVRATDPELRAEAVAALGHLLCAVESQRHAA